MSKYYEIVYKNEQKDVGLVLINGDIVLGWSIDPITNKVHIIGARNEVEWRGTDLVTTIESALSELRSFFQECVQCGYCCKKAPCSLGSAKYGISSPCGGLRFEKGHYWCGLVLDSETEKERKYIKDQLYINAGCCSSLNSDRQKIIQCQKSPTHTFSAGTQKPKSGKSGKKKSSSKCSTRTCGAKTEK